MSRQWVYKEVVAGRIPAHRVGSYYKVDLYRLADAFGTRLHGRSERDDASHSRGRHTQLHHRSLQSNGQGKPCSTVCFTMAHILKCGPRSWRTKTDLLDEQKAG